MNPWAATARWRLLNIRYLRGHPGRSLLSLGVIAMSAALIVAVLGTYGSLTGSVADAERRVTGNADLEISGITDTGLDQELADRIAETPGVATAAPIVRAPVRVDGRSALLLGIDRRAEKVSDDLRDGLRAMPRAADVGRLAGVVAGPGLDREIAAAPGTTVRVTAVTGVATPVTVLDVALHPGARALNRGDFVVAALPLAQRLTGRAGRIDSVLVVAAPGVDADRLRDGLAEVVGERAVVGTPGLRAAQAADATALTRNMTLLVALVALVVAAFLIFNSMNMAATERRGQIATLRVLGGRRRTVLRDFLVEAAALGLAGAVLGAPLGALAAYLSVSRLPPFLVSSFDVAVGFVLPAYAVPVAVVACVVTCVLAALLPARRVFAVQPVEALRPLEPGARERPGRGRAPAVAGGLVIVAGLVAALTGDGGYVLVTGPLLMIGIILLALASAGPITTLTARAAGLLGIPGRLASLAVSRAPRRVWATVMTVAIGVAVGVMTVGATRNAVTAASGSVASLRDADLYVQSTPAEVLPTGPLLPPSMVRRIAGVPGVAEVSPGQLTYAAVDGTRILVEGFAAGSAAPAFHAADARARRGLLAGEGAVISRRWAAAQQVAEGDLVTLPTPAGPQRLRVLDVIDYISFESGMVAISLGQMERWFGRAGATYVEIRARPGTDPAALRRELAALGRSLPYPVHVISGDEQVKATQAAVQQTGALSLALVLVVAGTTGLALFNTLMLSVVERRREIGILRAIGAGRRLTGRSVLAEAGAVAVVGGVLGLLAGTALHYVGTVVISGSGMLAVPFRPEPPALLLAAGALVLSLAGAVLPARRAGRLNVIDAISYE